MSREEEVMRKSEGGEKRKYRRREGDEVRKEGRSKRKKGVGTGGDGG